MLQASQRAAGTASRAARRSLTSAAAPCAEPRAAAQGHLELTTALPHAEVTAAACVVEARDDTPHVRFLRLRVDDARFSFAPGQWLDLWPPGHEAPGGYSIASAPEQLARDRTIDLAVKRSRHASATWAHAAAPGDATRVRVGGGFVPTAEELARPLLLLAGGIGITPLASIARHAADLAAAAATGGSSAPQPPPHVRLVYSCRSGADFALLPELRAAEAASGGRLRVELRVTGAGGPDVAGARRGARLGRDDVAAALRAAAAAAGPCAHVADVTTFLCGPPAMTDALEAHLLALQQPADRIRLERWW